jgi:hypothetical protein
MVHAVRQEHLSRVAVVPHFVFCEAAVRARCGRYRIVSGSDPITSRYRKGKLQFRSCSGSCKGDGNGLMYTYLGASLRSDVIG